MSFISALPIVCCVPWSTCVATASGKWWSAENSSPVFMLLCYPTVPLSQETPCLPSTELGTHRGLRTRLFFHLSLRIILGKGYLESNMAESLNHLPLCASVLHEPVAFYFPFWNNRRHYGENRLQCTDGSQMPATLSALVPGSLRGALLSTSFSRDMLIEWRTKACPRSSLVQGLGCKPTNIENQGDIHFLLYHFQSGNTLGADTLVFNPLNHDAH